MTSSLLGQIDDQNVIKNTITDFNTELSKLHKSKNKNDIPNYLASNYSYTNVYHSIDGSTKVVHGNMDDYQAYLDLIINQIQVSYVIANFYNVHIKDDIAIVAFDVEFKSEKEGGIISKGYESQICTLKKIEGQWKLRYTKKASLEESLDKGICLAELFKGKGYDYIAKVRVPTGTHFSMEMQEFKFIKLDNGDKTVEVSSNAYLWDSSKNIWTKKGNKKDNKIGFGLNENQVASIILLKDLYTEHCTDIQMRN